MAVDFHTHNKFILFNIQDKFTGIEIAEDVKVYGIVNNGKVVSIKGYNDDLNYPAIPEDDISKDYPYRFIRNSPNTEDYDLACGKYPYYYTGTSLYPKTNDSQCWYKLQNNDWQFYMMDTGGWRINYGGCKWSNHDITNGETSTEVFFGASGIHKCLYANDGALESDFIFTHKFDGYQNYLMDNYVKSNIPLFSSESDGENYLKTGDMSKAINKEDVDPTPTPEPEPTPEFEEVKKEIDNFIGLDKNFNLVKFFNPLNVQWRRRYNTYGDFEMQIIKADWNSNIKYVYHQKNNEVAIINKIEFNKTAEGYFINLAGYFYEYVLANRTQGFFSKNNNVEDVCFEQVNGFLLATKGDGEDYPIVLGTKRGYSYTQTWKSEPDELGNLLYKFLEKKEMSQRLSFDFANKNFKYEVYQGKNRTQEQKSANYCVFSDELGNITNINLVEDDSAYKNTCDVMSYITIKEGEEEYDEPIVETVYYNDKKPTKEFIKKCFIDIGKLETENIDEIQAEMRTKGTLELLNRRKVENITFDLLPDFYEYRKDYNLGDKVSVVINSLKKNYQYRIIEIQEIFANNTKTIKITVGDRKIKQFSKGRYN